MYLENATTAGRIAANRMLEALGAAGCAAFFVLSCVAGLEFRAELSRDRVAPPVEILLPSLGAIRSAHWSPEKPAEMPAQAPLASVEPSRTPHPAARPRRRSAIQVVQVSDSEVLAQVARTIVSELQTGLGRLERTMVASVEKSRARVVRAAPPSAVASQPPAAPEPAQLVEQPAAKAPQPPPVVLASGPAQSTESGIAAGVKLPKQDPPALSSAPTPDRVDHLAMTQAAALPEPVQESVVTAPAPSVPEPPRVVSKGVTRVEGVVPADAWMSLSFKGGSARVVTFVASDGSSQAVPVNSQGWVQVPPARGTSAEYSFRAPVPRAGAGIIRVETPDRSREALAAVLATPGEVAKATFSLAAMESPGFRIRGRVIEAESLEPRPVVGVEVQLVGDASRVAITDERGVYDLGEVATVPEGKLFIEATRPGGFKHRYEVLREDQELFLFPEQRLLSWSRSFEGGLSPSSGWVVAAIQNPSRQTGLRPFVVPGASMESAESANSARNSMVPEIYGLTAENNLSLPEADALKQEATGRWLAVEIPEGTARVGVQDSSGRELTSSWSVISPGVINVILLGGAR